MRTKINSRSKGCKGERMACSWMKKWTKRDFARVPASGGLHWKKANANGDIICTEEGVKVPFCIEVKNYRDINFSHLITSPKNIKIMEFWEQCTTDAARCNKIPMLMMRYNGLPKDFFFIVISSNIYHVIQQKMMLNFIDLTYLKFKTKEHDLMILDSRQLIQIPYKEIKLILKEYLKNHYGKKVNKN